MYTPSLEYFLVISRELNISQAAKKIHVSQQSLSAYIQRLEKYYGTKLFERRPNFQLTEAGKCLYEAGVKIEKIHQSLNQELVTLSDNPTSSITLGLYRPNGTTIMRSLPLVEFGKKYPNVTVSIIEEPNPVLRRMLQDNQLDICITTLYDEDDNTGLEAKQLYFAPEYVIITDELLARYFPDNKPEMVEHFYSGVDLSEMSMIPMILPPFSNIQRKTIDQFFEERGITPILGGQTTNQIMMFHMALNNYGLALSPAGSLLDMYDRARQLGLPPAKCFPIRTPSLGASVGMLYAKRDSYPPVLLDLISMIESAVKTK